MPEENFAHYEIIELLGRGGMGEVYRARDLRLGREVALKVLPEGFAQDPERVARFRREAKVLASLNHPRIASIYGLEEREGRLFLAMELAEGEELSARIERGPLPLEEVTSLARQLAEGLEEAHERGVVHRDLKPANIKVSADGVVKILDFGLARAFQGEVEEGSDPAQSPTITAAMTQVGTILGTAAYMSPEQAKGKRVDRRCDIWAFGVIVHEMLTGRRLFTGDTVSETLAGVLKEPISLEELPAKTSPSLRLLVERCLQRDPRRRLQHMGDARWFLEGGVASSAPPPAPASRRPGPWMAATALLALALGAALWGPWWNAGKEAAPLPLRKSAQILGGGDQSQPQRHVPALSPSGSSVVYMDEASLWILERDRLQPRRVEGSEGGTDPFWSPDGRWIAFHQEGKILKVSHDGGLPTPIGAFTGSERMGSASSGVWLEDGRIVLGTGMSGLLTLPAQGGALQTLLPTREGVSDYHEVGALPGGRGLVYVVHRDMGFGYLEVLPPDGEARQILEMDENVRIARPCWSATGHIVFECSADPEGIWALPFSLDDLSPTGPAFPVAPEGRAPSVASDGSLAYVLREEMPPAELAVLDREGRTLQVLAQVDTRRPYPSFSPDDSLVALCVDRENGREVMIFDAAVPGRERRLTWTSGSEEMAVFRPASDEVWYYAGSPFELFAVRQDGGEPREVMPGIMPAFTSDGEELVFARLKAGSFDFDLYRMEVGAEPASAQVLVEGKGLQWAPRISPDGRWLAYTSDESGTEKVFLTPYPEVGMRWEVSPGFSSSPRFRGDSREIYFTDRNAIYAVSLGGEDRVSLGIPRKLFDRRAIHWSETWMDGFDVSADGRRFVLVQPTENGAGRPDRLVLVQNWFAEFAAR